MKTRIVLIAENDNPIPEGHSKEEVEDLLNKLWEFIATLMSTGDDHVYIESAELVEETKESQWEHLWDAPDGTYKGRCPRCGFVHAFIESHDSQYNYCPQCGLKMKGE